jgi:hypothetical protein
LPKLLREDNAEEVRSNAEFTLALAALERYLASLGISADLHCAKITRLDIASTKELPRKVREYERALRYLGFPRMERTRYEGTGYRWSNGSRRLVFYDKVREQTKGAEDSCTARLEYRLTRSQAVDQHAPFASTTDSLLENMEDLDRVYEEASSCLLSAAPDALPSITEPGFDALYDELEGMHAATKNGLLVTAIKMMQDAGILEAYVAVTKERENAGKQPANSAYRLRKMIDKLLPYTACLDKDEVSAAELMHELSEAFAPAD